MQDTGRCPSCSASIAPGASPCPQCGSLLAGTRAVAEEPIRQEALMAFDLLQSAGFHPILTFQDDSGVPHPIEAEEPFLHGSGLMVPVTTRFSVYVPESEADESEQVLLDARRAGQEIDA